VCSGHLYRSSSELEFIKRVAKCAKLDFIGENLRTLHADILNVFKNGSGLRGQRLRLLKNLPKLVAGKLPKITAK